MALPQNFDPNKSNSAYMKFQPGDNKFRVLGTGIAGYVWWTDGKPVRRKVEERIAPSELPVDQKPRLFLTLPVWNYSTDRVEILEITQRNVQKTLNNLEKDPDWGELTEYDIKVSKTGSGMETEYATNPVPKKELSEDIKKSWKETTINLDALYEGGNPFGDF